MPPTIADIVRRFREGVPRQITRSRKYLWQRRHLDPDARKTPIFVVGCGRSGTSMMVRTLTKCPMTRVYAENAHAACSNYRLRSGEVLEKLIRKSYAPIVVFKPLCDSHLTDRLLQRHTNSRALWMFRHYSDVTNSTVRKWQGHQKDVMRWIHDGQWTRLSWRGERLGPRLIDMVTSLYSDAMTFEDAAALQWYLRNTFLFDLGLATDRRVLLVEYEDLVSNPVENFKKTFDFMGCPFEPRYVDDVSASSVKKAPPPSIDPKIQSLCDEMTARLEQSFAARGSR